MKLPALRSLPAALILSSIVLFSAPAARARTTFTPGVQVKAEYDDNILFSRVDEMSDWIASLKPYLDLHYGTERLSTKTSVAVEAQRYIEESEFDRENIFFTSDLSYLATERVSLNADFAYTLDSILESELDETGLVVGNLEDRQRLTGGGGMTYYLSELQNLEFNFFLSATEYDSETRIDYDTAGVNARWNRSFKDQRSMITVQPYWNKTSSDVSEVQTYGLLFGWSKELTEKWTFTAFVGPRYTTTDYSLRQAELVIVPPGLLAVDIVTVNETESNWGGVADININYKGETWRFTGSFNRDISYSSLGDPIDRDRFNARITKIFSRRVSAHLAGDVYFSENEGEFSSEDSESFSISPTLSYKLTENHVLTAGYRYNHYDDKTTDTDAAEKNRVWVAVKFNFPRYQ